MAAILKLHNRMLFRIHYIAKADNGPLLACPSHVRRFPPTSNHKRQQWADDGPLYDFSAHSHRRPPRAPTMGRCRTAIWKSATPCRRRPDILILSGGQLYRGVEDFQHCLTFDSIYPLSILISKSCDDHKCDSYLAH